MVETFQPRGNVNLLLKYFSFRIFIPFIPYPTFTVKFYILDKISESWMIRTSKRNLVVVNKILLNVFCVALPYTAIYSIYLVFQ